MYRIEHKEIRDSLEFCARAAVNIAFAFALLVMIIGAPLIWVCLTFAVMYCLSVALMIPLYVSFARTVKKSERPDVVIK